MKIIFVCNGKIQQLFLLRCYPKLGYLRVKHISFRAQHTTFLFLVQHSTSLYTKAERYFCQKNKGKRFTAKHYRSSKRMESSSGEWFLAEPSIVVATEQCHV
jgi:hypothetical protein